MSQERSVVGVWVKIFNGLFASQNCTASCIISLLVII